MPDSDSLNGAGHAADALSRWIIEIGLKGRDEARLLAAVCERLVAAGLPLSRAAAGSDILDPTVQSRVLHWRRGVGVEQYRSERDSAEARQLFLASPFGAMVKSGDPVLRRRLEPPAYRRGEFPLLDRLHDEGHTDYYALTVRTGEPAILGEIEGVIVGWLTDRPGGFSAAERAVLAAIMPALGLAYCNALLVTTTRTLLSTYLGDAAARCVMSGNVVRGRAEPIRAAIWLSDLVDFTRLADGVPGEAMLHLLNDYAGALAGAVAAGGGQVLKFIGDGILATFEAASDAEAADRALAAALAASEQVRALNARRRAAGEPATDFYLALHFGEAQFGNFGAPTRLDFTVLGRAVNEASRILAMCRPVERSILVSEAFAHALGDTGRLVPLGRYALRGVEAPQALFTPDPARVVPAR
ncbi:MAG: adenylate/guanylate cyclase domain-containing protein [Rhodospirillaceae bacterium]|nr:adenylate/guanylate cyclase domain-containing protein [Rhodospirillaceae bacterium]